MKITAPEEYGLRCLLRIARNEGLLTIPEIAAAEGLSAPYVAKLLGVLRQSGIIDSSRGRGGGYRLAVPAESLRLGSILMILGEPLFDEPIYCERHAGTEANGNCVHEGCCTLKGLWQTLEDWIRHTLDQITLADLLQKGEAVIAGLRSQLPAQLMPPTRELIQLQMSNDSAHKRVLATG